MSGTLKKLAQRLGVSSDTLLIVGVAAAVGVVTAAAIAFTSSAKSEDESDPAAVSPAAQAPAAASERAPAEGSPAGGASSALAAPAAPHAVMSKEKLLRVLNRTRVETEDISVRLVQEMQQMSDSGLEMAEMQVQYQESMERLLRESEERIGSEFGFTKEELLAAHIAHKDDAEVQEAVEALKRVLFGEGGGESDEPIGEVPDGMTADVFLEIYQKQIEFIYESFVRMADMARTHAPRGGERIAALELAMQQNFEQIVAQSMQISGMDMPTFQACVQRFQGADPRFLQEAANNAQRLAELRQRLLEED